jgi:multidrug efflux pump
LFVWSVDSGLPTVDTFDSTSNGISLLSTKSYDELYNVTELLVPKLNSAEIVSDVYSSLKLDTKQITLDLNTVVLSQTKIHPKNLSDTLVTAFGGDTRVTFNKDGIEYPILVKNARKPWSISELYITNPDKQRISLSSLVDEKSVLAPKSLSHRNLLKASPISFNSKEGDSTDQTIEKVEKLLLDNKMENITYQWDGMFKAYLDSSNTMYVLLLLSIIFIYAILAVQFESFIDPFIILITVPLACFGSVVGLWVTGGSINIFSQIAIITLIGLISKHGILIVEFANHLHLEGKSYKNAAIEAALLRFRPILMTSITMILSAMPLVFASGAGAEIRNSIGNVLVYGLGIGTLFSVILIPGLYYIIKTVTGWFKRI